jgi:hypothetical protein
MADMTAQLRGIRWQYATDRIGLAALERKVKASCASKPASLARQAN